MANTQGKREIKSGLCPNCCLFGDKCSCGYNYGFPTGASFRRWKFQQKFPHNRQGKVILFKPFPVIVLHDNMQVYDIDSKAIYRIAQNTNSFIDIKTKKYYNSNDFCLTSLRILAIQLVVSPDVYPERELYYDQLDQLYYLILPVKYSQWLSCFENNEVDSDKKVIFEEITINSQNFLKNNATLTTVAKIIPRKNFYDKKKELAKLAFEEGKKSIATFENWWETTGKNL